MDNRRNSGRNGGKVGRERALLADFAYKTHIFSGFHPEIIGVQLLQNGKEFGPIRWCARPFLAATLASLLNDQGVGSAPRGTIKRKAADVEV